MAKANKTADRFRFVDDIKGYIFLGVHDSKAPYQAADPNALLRKAGQGAVFAPEQTAKRCAVCGAHLRYSAVMLNPDTRVAVLVGETCMVTAQYEREFRKAREAAARLRERERVAAAYEATLEEHPELAVLTYDELLVDYSAFVRDIAATLVRYGRLTDAQRTSVLSAIKQDEQKIMSRLAREAEHARLVDEGKIVEAPAGEQTIVGTINKVKLVYNDNYRTHTWKMIVLSTQGFKVWVTLRNSIIKKFLAQNEEARVEDMVGLMIAFDADLHPSPDDPYFAFGWSAKNFSLVG